MNKFFTLLLLTIVAISLQSQDINDIINSNIKARGGEELLMQLSTVEFDMTFENKMGKIDAKQYQKNNEAYRLEMQIMGMDNYYLINAEKGVEYFPIRGQKTPEVMPEPQYNMMKENLDLRGDLYDYKSKGYNFELIGVEEWDGQRCFVLSLMKEKSIEPKKFYISTENYQIVREVSIMDSPEGLVESFTDYSDYKATEEGYIFPYKIVSNMGTVIVKKVIINKEIPAEKFDITIMAEK